MRIISGLIAVVVGVLVLVTPAAAQTPPTIVVLGVGKVAFTVKLDAVGAQAQSYRAAMPDTATTYIALTVTCTGPAAPVECTFPLAQLPLTSSAKSLALQAGKVAADGEAWTPKTIAPFVLGLDAPPVGATFSATPIRPPSP